MQRLDFIALGPLLILSVFIVAVMVQIAIRRRHFPVTALTLFGLAATLFNIPFTARAVPRIVTPLLVIDGFALFYMGLILASAMATVAISHSYFEKLDEFPEEFYLLILIGTLGSMVIVCCRHVVSFFLGLEILSVSLYALSAYTRTRHESIESGLKYLVLAGVSASFFLFGAALIYAETGTMDFDSMGMLLTKGFETENTYIFMAGLGFVIVSLGFKLAVTPFHMWTPDIYQGAPTPVTAYVATVSKGAVAALLVRLFSQVDIESSHALYAVFAVMAMGSMIAGNLLALRQSNVKRLLAYSSIAHMGYLLTAFIAGGKESSVYVTFYLAAYSVSILGCFGVMACLSGKDRDADTLNDYRGLFFSRPWTAAVLTAMLLSLAGTPLTAGFIGKFFVVLSGAGAAHWGLVLTLALTSGAGLFYYLRIIVAMFTSPVENEMLKTAAGSTFPALSALTLTVLSTVLIWLGITPSWFLGLIGKMVR
jgi:NADH-quinone oxidoreductase subunit N